MNVNVFVGFLVGVTLTPSPLRYFHSLTRCNNICADFAFSDAQFSTAAMFTIPLFD